MRYDDDRNSRIRELKRRYNRRFRLALHGAAWLALLIASAFVAWLGGLAALALLALIPHALVVAWQEYQDWLKRHVTQQVDALDTHDAAPGKRKRYESDADPLGPARFRLTDDGEIEPVSDGQAMGDVPPKAKRGAASSSSRPVARPADEPPHKRRGQRRRDDDTDEFNVRALFKKLKDLVD